LLIPFLNRDVLGRQTLIVFQTRHTWRPPPKAPSAPWTAALAEPAPAHPPQSHDVANQFTVISIRKRQHIAAIFLEGAFLHRVPSLASHPTCPLWREPKLGPALRRPVEDAVAVAQGLINRLDGNHLGWGLQQFKLGDGINAEVAHIVAQMAPGIQIPVVAVMHQPLR
jgi:hypothetical protein